eukprot:CAMPEP_0194286624 /NCGR_PEP_ID=MMETSP0169-20130528/32896_1 /TAXON_ID=218684 /ORGANISM="Corethron pennatum, Strain L29A3" /LENGTH=320 /DNA_ID=CAMNT_0039033107 /DNA_START=298 /DNA_END=1257 /DNA_ORIENTATION=+
MDLSAPPPPQLTSRNARCDMQTSPDTAAEMSGMSGDNHPLAPPSWRGSYLTHDAGLHPLHEAAVPEGSPASLLPPSPQVKQDAAVTATPTQDILAGGMAGMSSVVVGHPLDTIKVRLQTSTSTLSGTVRAAASGGAVRSLFSGMGAPLASATAVNAVVFATYGWSSRALEPVVPDIFWRNVLAGCYAGLMQGLVICPTEHIKCRLQTAGNSSGPVDTTMQIWRSHGISGLYRGWWSTAWREVPAFGMYFSCYEYIKEELQDRVMGLPPYLASMCAGGASGCFTWAVIYPVDVVKTRIQTMPMSTPVHQRRMLRLGADIAS